MPVTAATLPPRLEQALTRASQRNGVDFSYLLQTAMRESSLDPQAKAATSSAVGLFQFLEGTWLEVIKEEGPALGYGELARQIRHDSDGGYSVPDPAQRAKILALREDPGMAADMAAAFTRRNGTYLAEKFGRNPSPGELYIAHFMGARGAEQFFALGLKNADAVAAEHFPRQAAANRPIFYENGRPRTVREVYQVLVRKHENTGQASTAEAALAVQQMASANPAQTRPQGSPVEVMLPNVRMSFVDMYQATPRQQAAAQPAQRTEIQQPDQPPDQAVFEQFFSRLFTN
ncbi:transglycosylase SLT domain-containing protein [Cucumibacter marinus]|uniref:transglycosylase SLT domain-containing protein n=1 Tax=Cucumibacter marinus TaxID=1121252 RepID=UPI00068610C3|nr:transglycosylase SLT domain-containing protein [Cucumibacter marinus]